MSMQLQSILFHKALYTKRQAVSWLKRYSKKTDIDTAKNYYRARQVSPKSFRKTTFRVLEIKPGLAFVIAKPKRKRRVK